jgi:hypothetical protein
MAEKQVDPVENLKELLNAITKIILKAFPQLVAVIALIFFAILAILLFLFNGTTILP